MKYMTPELLVRYQSDDDQTALVAYSQWEQAGERYRTELQAIRQRLPQAAVELAARFCLHDARVIWAALSDGVFVVVLMLEGDAGGLQIEYDLTEPMTLTVHPEIAEECPLEWLYDEFALASDGASFVHTILFTDGGEVRLAFKALRWRLFPKSMFVAPLTSVAAGSLADLVAA